jgi:aminoglycoside/choline kinase family phosphotransferase
MADLLGTSTEAEIHEWVSRTKTVKSVERIPGDASTRRYYRIHADKNSYILMRMESFLDQGLDLPFLTVQKHLALSGVDVPAILDVDPGRGIILLEDLGDRTLLRELQEVGDAEKERHLYERVIDSLVHMQYHASPAQRPNQIDAFKLRFDFEKLNWEIQFTIEQFYELYLKRTIKPEHRKIMDEGFGEICRTLASEPVYFTHRDFHSRNVMVTPKSGHEPRFVMIDFQDGRLGPLQYDLASLLKDSYYQLEEAQIERLLDYYVARWEALSKERLDRNRFRVLFDWMAVQRNFKAIGSFASFQNKRGDSTYLKYVGNTFENIRRNLLRYPQFSALREVLFHYYYF